MSEVILDSKQWEEFLFKLDTKVKNPALFLLALANTMGFADIVKHFETESGPDGSWQPRKDSTNKAYDILGGAYRSSNKILQLTGRLKGSLLPGTGESKIIDRYTVKLSSPVVYAHRHDIGTSGMPQREFMWLSEQAKSDILQALLNQLVEE